MNAPRYLSYRAGFTLVELVIVIILLGILAVSALPRILGSDGVSEYTYQARLISALRTMQLRAMNDVRPDFCFQINIYTAANSSFGPPTLDYSNGNQAATCQTTIDSSAASDHVKAEISEMADDGVSILSGGGSVQFNGLGCPNLGSGFCATSGKITIEGSKTVSVCIESQGYVHACD